MLRYESLNRQHLTWSIQLLHHTACMVRARSEALGDRIADMDDLCSRAESRGFEFKVSKGQFNQEELELWGCFCGEFGRRAMPPKIEQLQN